MSVSECHRACVRSVYLLLMFAGHVLGSYMSGMTTKVSDKQPGLFEFLEFWRFCLSKPICHDTFQGVVC